MNRTELRRAKGPYWRASSRLWVTRGWRVRERGGGCQRHKLSAVETSKSLGIKGTAGAVMDRCAN